MESSLSEQKEVNIRQLNEINLLSEKLNNEARRIRSLEREGDRLRSAIALLESKVVFWVTYFVLLSFGFFLKYIFQTSDNALTGNATELFSVHEA